MNFKLGWRFHCFRSLLVQNRVGEVLPLRDPRNLVLRKFLKAMSLLEDRECVVSLLDELVQESISFVLLIVLDRSIDNFLALHGRIVSRLFDLALSSFSS
uniref:Uncharacterized protein n=1 Tax=Strombidium inclinatum TaxID=197538 RepID=A0A7S3IQ49_9SPIT